MYRSVPQYSEVWWWMVVWSSKQEFETISLDESGTVILIRTVDFTDYVAETLSVLLAIQTKR
jgi:hypothetical protein